MIERALLIAPENLSPREFYKLFKRTAKEMGLEKLREIVAKKQKEGVMKEIKTNEK